MMKKTLVFITSLLLALSMSSCRPEKDGRELRGVVIYPSDVTSVGIREWDRRIKVSGINLVGIHAATFHEPLDSLEAFVRSRTGRQFLRLCRRRGVDVEYELHVLQLLLPRDLYGSHPEYFRMDASGARQQKYNMCFTCDEAFEAMRPQVREMMKWLRPTTHRYFLWTDDVQGAFCQCESCREYSPSEQALLYENRLLEMLREYDPKATLAHLAYVQTMEAPRKVEPAEGVFLEYAPIERDYSQALPQESRRVLEENLEVFPKESLHILEYWLDESMFSRWKRNALVPLPFDEQNCRRDVNLYRNLGARSITCFATWLNASYMRQYGSVEECFRGYGRAFSNGESPLTLTFGSKPSTVRGFHAPWHGLADDDTALACMATEDSLVVRFEVNEKTFCYSEDFPQERVVDDEDRVELFFSPTGDMSEPYYCMEIDPLGRPMDYKAVYYREMDYGWTFPGVRISSSVSEGGYSVEVAFAKSGLASLGIDPSDGFWLGAFRADFRTDGSVDWYSLRSTADREADFHKPDILVPCRAAR
jgi:hypothetical protein